VAILPQLRPGTRSKIRNIMSALFNHAMRYADRLPAETRSNISSQRTKCHPSVKEKQYEKERPQPK
jgi:hypothetical protein